jgi:hypothetical protein
MKERLVELVKVRTGRWGASLAEELVPEDKVRLTNIYYTANSQARKVAIR